MNINRSNYEAFFLDFLEKRLTDEQVNELMAFIVKNRDLEDELYCFENVVLEPESLVFNAKETLKKQKLPVSLPTISFDELCVARLEGDLTPVQTADFDTYIAADKNLSYEYQLFTKTKLQLDESLVYDNKRQLKKFALWQNRRKVFFYSMAAAASVVLLIGLYLFVSNNKQQQNLKHAINKELKNQNSVPYLEDSIKSNRITNPFDNEPVIAESKTITTKKSQIQINEESPVYTISTPEREIIAIAELSPITDYTIAQNELVEPVLINKELKQSLALIEILGALSSEDRELILKDYLTVEIAEKRQQMMQSLRSAVLDAETDRAVKFWDVVGAGFKGYSKMTGRRVELKTKYNDEGKIVMLAFQSEGINFSAEFGN